ncbi:auxin efflux carrier component 2-like [Humulus lupulus]|uniref:auxin efflux carrier component 2-like n=1 Tax=Humulus lupulus TaxID=3486 RepID=UPI002B40186E|nr:auxin efflux carrier component 2-like [Humulus lupulus]
MITGEDFYQVLSAVVPLYAAMALAYASVRWWKIFTPEQCAGVNRFVAIIAVPFLSFKLIIHNNPYEMNFDLILADTLQKIVIFLALVAWKMLSKHGSLDWTITLNSLATLPNTLVMGVPLMKAMYGDFSASLMVQIVVFQGVLWNTLLLVMFEYRAAKIFIGENFPATAGSIASFTAEPDVVSLAGGGGDSLHAEAEIDTSGRLHVKVRRSSSLSASSVLSFRKIHGMGSAKSEASNGLSGVEIYSTRSSFDQSFNQADFGREILRTGSRSDAIQLHMSVWNSSAASSYNNNRSFSATDLPGNKLESLDDIRGFGASSLHDYGSKHDIGFEEEEKGEEKKKTEMPPASVVTKLILTMVWRKFVRNPNTYSSIVGLVWSLIAFRVHIKMPIIIEGIITILANTGLGMAMFSLGLFMALQPKIISCGKSLAAISMAVRFLVGPGVMAATSAAIGIRGILLQVSIVQAALPQAIISFVFGKEYNLHPEIMSTSVIIGMVVALPVTIIYYVLLGL